MTSRNFSGLDDINYSFDQMEALGATIDDIGFADNYYGRISLLGESHVVINPKLIRQLLSTLIGTGAVYIRVPVSGETISIVGNKDIIASMEGQQNLASAIQGMRDYISTFKGEFIRIE
jgi:hypothetical protein